MVASSKANGRMTSEMGEDTSVIQIRTPIKANLLMEKLKVKGCIHGIIQKYMMENGKLD